MKVAKIELNNFKRHQNTCLDFTDPLSGLANDVVVLVGRNGSGKTTVLQAVAAVLGTACGVIKDPKELVWPGFDLELVDLNHSEEKKVQLQMAFSEAELTATHTYWEELASTNPNLYPPAQDRFPVLTLSYEGVRAETAAQLFQFRGREYAKQLVRTHGYAGFERVGSVFWYTDHRTAFSLTPDQNDPFNEDVLRRRLNEWFVKRWRRGSEDPDLIINRLESLYRTVFPGRSFSGPKERGPQNLMSDSWFMLHDGVREYELSEMSGAEKALFPILMDFASWRINHSVILIDELELHLHPPLQQHLLQALQKMGKNNQFIITTHSDFVCSVAPEGMVYRLGDAE